MSRNIVVIVGAIAGQKGITLYHADGKETNLALEGWRTKQIMDQVTPFIRRREKVEIDLDSYDVHAHIEKKSGGLIRFVREKIASVRTWFKPEAQDEASQGVEAFQPTKSVEGHTYGVQAASPEAETVVAIIGDTKLPGVDALEGHMEHALREGDTEGVENFMKRCAAVVKTRGHSIQELLNFMRRGDLPIAKDGSIVAYKVLKTKDGKIVDCASGNVVQRVGSRVVMDDALVDPSRRTECSSGLHIARRGYLSSFSGDVIMLVKIAPEDVVAVPMGEPNKMRVAAYHIVGQIPPSVHGLLRSNRPMTGNDAASKMLADALAGNHLPPIEEVRIRGAYGANLQITPLVEQEPEIVAGTSGTAKALDDENQKPAITIKELREAANDAVPGETTITTQHVQMIDGDLHVDGKKIDPEEKRIVVAAVTAEARPAKKAKPKKAKAPKPEAATAALSTLVNAEVGKLPQKHRDALRLHGEGKSNRAIEAELHICRKTLKKLFDKNGLKPNG